MTAPCINNIARDFELDPKQVEEMIDYFSDLPVEQLLRDTDDLINRVKFHRKSNIVAETHRLNQSVENRSQVLDGHQLRDPDTKTINTKSQEAVYENFLSMLVGNAWKKVKTHALDSIASIGSMKKMTRMGQIVSEFEKVAGINTFRRFTKDKQFRKDFIEELDNWETKPKTGNKEAHLLAGLVYKSKYAQVSELNTFGAGMAWRTDHVTQHWHDKIRIAEAGPDEWLAFINPLLKNKATEETFQKITKFGDETEGMSFNSVKDQLQYERQLHFKDVQSWEIYNSRFGYSDSFDSTFRNMDMIDERIAMFQQFGPNPRQEFGRLLDELEGQGLFEDVSDFQKRTRQGWRRKNRLISAWNQVSGEGYTGGSPTLNKFTSGMLAFQIITKLGKSAISAFNDIALTAINLHSQGMGPLTSYGKIFKQYHRRITQSEGARKAELQYVIRQLGVGMDGMLGFAMSRFNDMTSVSGRLQKMAQQFFDLNGLNAWTDMGRDGFGRMVSNHFALQLGKNFDDLDINFQNRLKEYGITKKDWGKLSEIGGFNLRERLRLEPEFKDIIDEISDDVFMTPDWVLENGGSKKLSDKLATMFSNESRFAVPEAGPESRAFMMRTFDRGSVLGNTALLFWQFRSYPIAMAQRVYPRMYELGMPSLIHTLPLVMLGYASLAVKDLIVGKEPRDPLSGDTFLESTIQSGILGILGDTFLAEAGKNHSSFDEALLGPNYETFKDIAQLSAGLASGQAGATDALETLRNNTPYMNLFYTDMAWNYLVHYQLMETFKPGYVNNLEEWNAGVGQQEYLDITRPSNFVSYGGLR